MIVSIIGFGVSGLSFFYNAVKKFDQGKLHINILSPIDFFITGVAYGSFNNSYELNVSSGDMSIDSDNLNDYYEWLIHGYPQIKIERKTITPRFVYGLYLQDKFRIAKNIAESKGITYSVINSEAVAIDEVKKERNKQNYLLIYTDIGSVIYTNKLVLSSGPSVRKIANIASVKSNFVKNGIFDIWSKSSIILHRDTLPIVNYYRFGSEMKPISIAVLGTGMSAIDILVNIYKSGFNGYIYCISGKGLFPMAHKQFYPGEYKVNDLITKEITEKGCLSLLRTVRKFLAKNRDIDIVDIAYHTRWKINEIWSWMNAKEKIRFMRHLMPFWTVARHRTSQNNIDIINNMIKIGMLKVIKGKVVDVQRDENKNLVYYTNRFHQENIIFSNVVINAMGPDLGYTESDITQNMFNMDYLGHDQVGYYSKDDRVELIGQIKFGEYMECGSVPEIRTHAGHVAEKIINKVSKWDSRDLKVSKS